MCIHRGSICKVNCGGYSSGVTPLPIPNRAVKPVCADGSALPGVRVGCCRALRYRMILINIFRYLSFYPRSTSWPTPVGCRGPYSPDPLSRFAPRFLVGILFLYYPWLTACTTSRAISKQPSGLLQRAAAGRRYDNVLPYSSDKQTAQWAFAASSRR